MIKSPEGNEKIRSDAYGIGYNRGINPFDYETQRMQWEACMEGKLDRREENKEYDRD